MPAGAARPTSERERTGVLIGSGIGGLATIAETAVKLEQSGPRRVSPFFIPASLINLASGQVSIRFGFKGPEPLRSSPPARPAPTRSAMPRA